MGSRLGQALDMVWPMIFGRNENLSLHDGLLVEVGQLFFDATCHHGAN